MVNVRQHNPTNDHPPDHPGARDPGRLNLLLSCEPPSRPTDEWSSQLPRLLEPMGVTAVRASSGAEAARLIRSTQIHIAIVDLSIPLEEPPIPEDHDHQRPAAAPQEGGRRILQLLSRLDAPPPTLVVKARRTKREDARALQAALTAGAFAVLDRPVNLETVLRTMGRAVRKHYADRWPDA